MSASLKISVYALPSPRAGLGRPAMYVNDPAKTINNKTINRQQQQQQQQRQQRNRVQRTNAPEISRDAAGIRIRHREYLSSINIANSGFEVFPAAGGVNYGDPLVLHINPADGQVFPWLSNIAPNFESYKFNSLKFEYSSSVSSFTTGAILIVPEFDPHNSSVTTPSSLSELLNKQYATSGNVWSNFQLSVPSNKFQKKLVRAQHHTTHSSEHLRQTDACIIYVALYNVTDLSTPFGEIFVEYDVTLMEPNYTGTSVKSHVHSVPSTAFTVLAGEYAPLMGTVAAVNDPAHLGDDNSTLGVLTHTHNGVGTIGGNNVDATRLTFQEPFNGLVHFRCTNHTGSMVSSAKPANSQEHATFAYTTTPDNLAQIEELHNIGTGGAGADWAATWKVIAKAGEIVDFFWDQTGNLAFSEAVLTLAELAAGLLL